MERSRLNPFYADRCFVPPKKRFAQPPALAESDNKHGSTQGSELLHYHRSRLYRQRRSCYTCQQSILSWPLDASRLPIVNSKDVSIKSLCLSDVSLPLLLVHLGRAC